jgi:hypothetical protein
MIYIFSIFFLPQLFFSINYNQMSQQNEQEEKLSEQLAALQLSEISLQVTYIIDLQVTHILDLQVTHIIDLQVTHILDLQVTRIFDIDIVYVIPFLYHCFFIAHAAIPSDIIDTFFILFLLLFLFNIIYHYFRLKI